VKKNSFALLELEMADLERFWTKTPLGPLGVKVDEFFFFPEPMGDIKVLEAKKTTFSSRNGLCNILFPSLGELGTCLQNLISTRSVQHWEKNMFHNEVC
jgi:hypothetical protein